MDFHLRAGVSRPAFFLGLVLLAAAACSTVPPLAHTHATPEALARSVLDAVEAGDRPALLLFALSEQEFRDHIWPELPASRPERNLPFSFVWGDLKGKSDVALDQTLSQYKGRRYELLRVTFAGETPYGSYRVMREATFHVRTLDGEAEELRLAGSFVQQGNVWKVFSYVIDS
ncbi:MAG: hypothetical protein AB7P99_01040 [Vicinamibacterales bacterium]